MELLVCGCIGISGTVSLARKHRDILCARYPKAFVESCCKLDSEKSEGTDKVSGLPDFVISVGEGGIFAALWELSKELECGLSVELPSIPICQETVEICEFFEINPYRLASEGCFLVAAESGYSLKKQLEKEGINASVIGITTKGCDKLIHTKDRSFFLTPPREREDINA